MHQSVGRLPLTKRLQRSETDEEASPSGIAEKRWAQTFFVPCMIMMAAALSARVYGRTNQNRGLAATDRKIAQAARVERAPRLDGTLSDPLWQSAEPIYRLPPAGALRRSDAH